MRSTQDRAVVVWSPGRGHCVVFLGETVYSHSTSILSGVQMSYGKLGVTVR